MSVQVCMTRSDPGAVHLHSVGCTAEIRQISRQDDAMLNIVAKGMPDCNVATEVQSLSRPKKAIWHKVCSTVNRYQQL